MVYWIKNMIFCGVLVFCYAAPLAAQECDLELDAKATKLVEKSKDKRKYKSAQRTQFLRDALEIDEECLECMYQLGKKAYLRAKNETYDFTEAISYLAPLVKLCPDYHSDPYFYLGAMSYADRRYTEALDYFDKFIYFPSDDESKLGRDYDENYETVKAAIPSVEFFKKYAENPVDYDPRKVEEISTQEGEEYLPVLSPDNEIIFFTKKHPKKSKGIIGDNWVEEFTMSKRKDINSKFGEPQALPAPFNLGDNYGGATISVDNKEMYIAKVNPNGMNPQNIDIYKTTYAKSYDKVKGYDTYRWSELESIGDHINTKQGWEAQPSLSSDGKLLFFASARPESVSGPDGNPSVDIYFCERQSDDSWGTPQNLESINTKGSDKTPFMHSDSRTLYFSSNAHRGFGGFDLFFTRQLDDSSWSEPENLGAPINSEKDEEGLIVATDGRLAYFSSKMKGSYTKDIFSFELPERAKPQKVMILKGTVKDDNDEVVQDLEIEIKSDSRDKSETIKIDQEDGSYAAIVNVEKEEDVVVMMKKDGYAFNAQLLTTKDELKKPNVIELKTQVQKIEANKPFVIKDINYSTSSSDIDDESKTILKLFSIYLKNNPSLKIEIRGHTDNVGNLNDNLALSTDRAFEVLGYLQEQGVESGRLTYKGFGPNKPLVSNDLPDGRLKNRRTEFVITKM